MFVSVYNINHYLQRLYVLLHAQSYIISVPLRDSMHYQVGRYTRSLSVCVVIISLSFRITPCTCFYDKPGLTPDSTSRTWPTSAFLNWIRSALAMCGFQIPISPMRKPPVFIRWRFQTNCYTSKKMVTSYTASGQFDVICALPMLRNGLSPNPCSSTN